MELLPIAQFVYNNQQHSMTGTTLFFANYGRNPQWQVTAEGNIVNVDKLAAIHKMMKITINRAQNTTARQLHDKRLKGPTLERGDKVYLSTKNLCLK